MALPAAGHFVELPSHSEVMIYYSLLVLLIAISRV